MKQKSRFVYSSMLCLMLLVTSCKESVESEAPSAPGEEEQATATETLPPSPSPSQVPVLQITDAITGENAAQIQELWRIGNGQYEEMKWSHNSQYAALGTGAGVFVMDREGDLLFSSFDGWANNKQISFSHDNSIMAAGFRRAVWLQQGKQPNHIVSYSLPSGEILNVINLGIQFQVEGIAFQEDGSLVAIGYELNENFQNDHIFIIHFDSLTGERLNEYQVQITGSYAKRLEISDKGKDLLIHFNDDPSINLFNNSGYSLGSIPSQEYSDITINGGYFAFTTWEVGNTIQVYKTNGVFLDTVEVDTGCADCVVMDFFIGLEGKSFYVNDHSSHFKVYSLPGLELQDEFELPSYASVYSPDFSRGIKMEDNEFAVTDLETGDVLGHVPNILDPIETFAVSPDHSHLLLAATGYDQNWDYATYVHVWNTSQTEIEKTITTQRNPEWDDKLESIAILGDGNTLMLHKQSNSTLEFWDISTSERVDTFSFSHEVNTVSASPDGNFVLGAERDLGLELWNRQTEELLIDNDDIYQYIGFYSPIFTPDSQTIMIGGSDTIMIWDMENVSDPTELKGNGKLAVNPQGSILAYHLGNSQAINLYDLDNLKVISEHEWVYGANDMYFNSDGSLLIISTYDGIFFWDIDASEILHTIEYSPQQMALSSDSKLLVTSSLDGTVRLWGIP